MRKLATHEELWALLETEADTLAFFERFRWAKGFCPHCGSDRRYYTTKDGTYKCARCRLRYSVQTGTVFQNSKVPLDKWLKAIWLIVYFRGIASTELAKRVGVTQKTAWLMLDRLYQASRTQSFKKQLVDDEEFDLDVVKMVSDLSRSLVDLEHPSDWKVADHYIGRLYTKRPYTNPSKVRRWAMRYGWSFDSAADLETIAKSWLPNP